MNKDESTSLSVIDKDKLITTLQNSLYSGAKRESVELVLSYCEAAKLDPMQKPVHLVPMYDKKSGGFKDVVMAGIGLYRILAARSETLAGIDEPVFGPDVTKKFTDKDNNQFDFTYPEWCKITVKKLVGNHLVEFTAKEYWLENYARQKAAFTAPNAMWKKRPKGQLAKCAEAQALRKGWPEVGQAPTAEEMEGKEIEVHGEAERVDEVSEPEQTLLPVYTDEDFDKNFDGWLQLIEAKKADSKHIINMIQCKYTLTDDQKSKIEGLDNANS